MPAVVDTNVAVYALGRDADARIAKLARVAERRPRVLIHPSGVNLAWTFN